MNKLEKYHGNFKEGSFHGIGIRKIFSTGETWEGTWVDGHLSGPGNKMILKGKTEQPILYEGETKNSQMSGKGKQTMTDGSWFEG